MLRILTSSVCSFVAATFPKGKANGGSKPPPYKNVRKHRERGAFPIILRHFSCKLRSAEDMEMEVGDCLAGVGAAV